MKRPTNLSFARDLLLAVACYILALAVIATALAWLLG